MSNLFRASSCLHVSQTVCPAPVARASHARTLINVNPFSFICVPASLTACPAPVARASHAHTLINVNPFSCLCVPECLHHASGTYLPFALNHMRLWRTDFDMFESVVVCKKIDIFPSYCIRQFLTIQFLLKITYMMFV